MAAEAVEAKLQERADDFALRIAKRLQLRLHGVDVGLLIVPLPALPAGVRVALDGAFEQGHGGTGGLFVEHTRFAKDERYAVDHGREGGATQKHRGIEAGFDFTRDNDRMSVDGTCEADGGGKCSASATYGEAAGH